MKHLIITKLFAGDTLKKEKFNKLIKNSFASSDFEIYFTQSKGSSVKFLKEYFSREKKETVRVYACGTGKDFVVESIPAAVKLVIPQ